MKTGGNRSFQTFRKADLNDDGYLSVNEASKYLEMEAMGPKGMGKPDWFTKMDKNGDGKISKQEFDSSLT